MATLTASATFTIAPSTVQTVAETTVILPPLGTANGEGRLVHPVLGTLDYTLRPDQWENLADDVIAPPQWESVQTLSAVVHTYWSGTLGDREVVESWLAESGLAVDVVMVERLYEFWQQPPNPNAADPAQRYLRWEPNYRTDRQYWVVLTAVELGGRQITENPFSQFDWHDLPLSLRMRVVGYAD